MERYNTARLKDLLKNCYNTKNLGGLIHQQPYSKRKNKGSFNNSSI